MPNFLIFNLLRVFSRKRLQIIASVGVCTRPSENMHCISTYKNDGIAN
jgi:hypothetical protein